MAHAISASSYRSDHMSPWALGLAVLLHALVGLALWWMMQHRSQPQIEEPIDITFEQPKPPEPPPPPPPQPQPQQAPKPPQPLPLVEGLRPPAPLTAERPTQVPPSGDRPKDPPAPPPPPLVDRLPTPEPSPPQEVAPQPQPPPPKAVEMPKPEPPPPAPQDHALAVPPPAPVEPPKPAPAQPQQHALVAPHPPPPQPPHPPAQPTPQLQRPEYRPSPLTTAPPRRPPGGAHQDDGSPSPFVNPADTYTRARVADNYLWQVVRKLQGYRYEARVNAAQGITVVRVVIARDGRLLNVDVARSSGYPEFDRGVLAGVRSGSPYAPLPPEIHGDSATFDLPLISINRR